MSTATNVGTTTAVARQAYGAFGRRDVPAILSLIADEVDWEFVGSSKLAYAGPRRSKQAVAEFFAAVAQADDIQVFEPREFIEAGSTSRCLDGSGRGRSTRATRSRRSGSICVTVKNGKITRWRGFFNTAARYGT